MTIPELAEVIRRANRQDRAATLILAAEAIYRVKLADGRMVRDAMDARDFLIELSEELGETASSASKPARGYNVDFCPNCGHVHVDDHECSFPIGGGRVCRCERQVTA